jgi:MYXO-CTERM domain-containing protein
VEYLDKVNFTAASTLRVATNITATNVGLRVSNGATATVQVDTFQNFTLASLGATNGAGTFNKTGAGTMTLTGTNTAANTNNVSAGRLVVSSGAQLGGTATVTTGGTLTVNGSVDGTVTASSGGMVRGSGTVGTLNINGIGSLAPGNSAGTLTATNGASWSQAGGYEWEIYDLAGPAGTGWDLLDVTGGTLDLSGITTEGGFRIDLITLTTDNSTRGALDNFNPTADYLTGWMIARAPTITGFLASEFDIFSGDFVGATGTFAIEQRNLDGGGQGLFITYTSGSEAIPEPGTWAAAALLAGAAGYVRWRRRKEQPKKA